MAKQHKSAETDLDFLLTTGRSGYFNVEKAKEVVEAYRKFNGDKSKICESTGLTQCSLANLLGELRKAAKGGYTLERYFGENRPLAAWKKKIK